MNDVDQGRGDASLEMPTGIARSTFIVRLWREEVNGEWRGQVVHVQSHTARYFTTLAQFEEFIGQHAPDFGARKTIDTQGVSHET